MFTKLRFIKFVDNVISISNEFPFSIRYLGNLKFFGLQMIV